MHADRVELSLPGREHHAAVEALGVGEVRDPMAGTVMDLQHPVEVGSEPPGHQVDGHRPVAIRAQRVTVDLGESTQAAGDRDGQRRQRLWKVAGARFDDLRTTAQVDHGRRGRPIRIGHLKPDETGLCPRVDLDPGRDLARNRHRRRARPRPGPVGRRYEQIVTGRPRGFDPRPVVVNEPLHVDREVKAAELDLRGPADGDRGRIRIAQPWGLLRVRGRQPDRRATPARPGRHDSRIGGFGSRSWWSTTCCETTRGLRNHWNACCGTLKWIRNTNTSNHREHRVHGERRREHRGGFLFSFEIVCCL